MVRIKFTGKYQKDLSKLLAEFPSIKAEIGRRVKLFASNVSDTRLDNHPLTKQMKGKFAFSIDDDVRIVYEWVGKSAVRFLAIGRHNKVYSKKQN